MSIQYPVPGFELTTFWIWVSSFTTPTPRTLIFIDRTPSKKLFTLVFTYRFHSVLFARRMLHLIDVYEGEAFASWNDPSSFQDKIQVFPP